MPYVSQVLTIFSFQRIDFLARMAPPPRQKFSFRSDSPFSAEQSTFIILKYGELKSTAAVRRAFGTKFHPKNPRKVPQQDQFQRVSDNFIKTASVRP